MPERNRVPDLVEDDDFRVTEEARILARVRNPEPEPLGAQELMQMAKKMADGQAKVALGSIIRTQNAQYKVKRLRQKHIFGFTYNVEVLKGLNLEKPPQIRTEPVTRNKMLLRYKMIRYMVTILQTAERGEPQFREHFPKLLDAGNTASMTFAVIEGTGDTLEEIMRCRLRSAFSRLTAYRVAMQTLIAIRDLHNHDWLHRFIRPQAFAVGLGARRDNIYMVDLGCPYLYRDPDTKKVRRPRLNFRSIGQNRYMSRHSHEAKDLARRDDLESWCYMCIEFFDLELLPWRNAENPAVVHKMKNSLVQGEYPEVFGKSSPALRKILKYAASMRYLERPDYKFAVQELREYQSMLPIEDTRNDWDRYDENEELDTSGLEDGVELPAAPRAPPVPSRDQKHESKGNVPKRGFSYEDDRKMESYEDDRNKKGERRRESHEPDSGKRKGRRVEDDRVDKDERKPTKTPTKPRHRTADEPSETEEKPKKKATKSSHRNVETEEEPKSAHFEKKAVRSQYLMAVNQQPEATEASASEKFEETEPVRKAKRYVHLLTDADMHEECVNQSPQPYAVRKLSSNLTTQEDTTTELSDYNEPTSSVASTPKKAATPQKGTTPKRAADGKQKKKPGKALYQTAEEEDKKSEPRRQPSKSPHKASGSKKNSAKPKKKPIQTAEEEEATEPHDRKKKSLHSASKTSTPKGRSTPRGSTPAQSPKPSSAKQKRQTQKSAKKQKMPPTQDDE